MPNSSPPLAGPRYEDLAGRTEALAKHFTRQCTEECQGECPPGECTRQWKPPADGSPDAGRALIQVFARMARHVLERVNRVPDRNFLAFLNLIGVEPAPPRPARVPLTFSLVERGSAEPIVPARTRVGASAQPGDSRDIIFETERELATTRARLVAALIRQPDGDRWADRTLAATGSVPGFYEAFGGAQPVEHALYVATDDLPHLPAGTTLTVTLGFASQEERHDWQALHEESAHPPLAGDAYYSSPPPAPPLLRWSYWNGSAWAEFRPAVQPGTTTWAFIFTAPADMTAVTVGARSARWLRARLTAWPQKPIPTLQSLQVRASVEVSSVTPDMALFNNRPVDLSMEFFPLGETPRLSDTFYLASQEVFSRPGATVTVKVTGSAELANQLVETPEPQKPSLTWEVSTSTGWTQLTLNPAAGTVTYPNDAFPKEPTTTTLPTNVAPVEVHGKRAHWLRIRLSKGNFGTGPQLQITTDSGQPVPTVVGSYRPPILEAVTLSYLYTPETRQPTCLTSSDFTVTERTGRGPFAPFVRPTAPETALYLGFDRPFAHRDTLLYIQVAPLEPGASLPQDAASRPPPKLVWEYSTDKGWAVLGAQDETRGFARSGLLQFIGPEHFAPRPALGRTQYWLRARLVEGSFPLMPRLGHVLTNTVWASHSARMTEEVLGSSDGSANQTFTLSQRPVLAGQRLEVRESEERWVPWSEVSDFHASGPEDRHYRLNRQTGEVRFGDGQYGRVPPRGVRNVRATEYLMGGGAAGNRPEGTVAQLKTTIAYVDAVTNREPSSGGANAESMEQVQERGPRQLRHGGRAVTAEDFEDLARIASPAVARAKAITPRFNPILLARDPSPGSISDAGRVEVVIVPFSPHPPPTPSLGLLQDVETYLRERSAPAGLLRVTGPDWIAVSTQVTLVPTTLEGTDALLARVRRALTDFLHPLTGGFGGTGWAFGELPRNSDIYRLVGSHPGVASVRLAFVSTPPQDHRSERTLVYSGTHTLALSAPQETR